MAGRAGAQEWAEALREFAAAQERGRLSAVTIEGRVRRLRRLAQATGRGPWSTSRQDVDGWLSSAASGDARKHNTIAVRAFYRWAVEVGRVSRAPVGEPAPATRYTLDARWLDAVAAFETAQARQALAPTTVALRVKHLTRFAAHVEVAPWAVTREQVHAWLESLPGTDPSRQQHRQSLRAFYRWALDAGHVATDPTDEPSRRAIAKPVPPAWRAPIAGYLGALRAAGRLESTVRARREILGRFARAHASLDPWAATLDDALEWMSTKTWQPETRRVARSALIGMYQWAEDTGRVDESPMRRFPIIRAGQARPRVALEDDYAAALGRASTRDALALRLAAEVGLRRGEVAVVHTRDLRRDGDRFELLVHGKGDRERTVPLPDSLAWSIDCLPAGYAFPGGIDGHASPRTVGIRVSRLLPEGVTMHMLRHRFATLAYSLANDLLTVQQLLGHSSPATTQHYVQVSRDRLRAAVEAVAATPVRV